MAIEGALQPWPGTCPPWKVYLNEEEHKYTVTSYTQSYYQIPWDAPPTSRHIVSGTGLLHKYFPQFDADACLDKYYDGWQKPWNKRKPEYKGKTRQEIKDMWEKNGRDASALGTAMHLDCELYYTKNIDANRDTDEWRNFMKFVEEVLPKHRMLVPEMRLFSPEHRLCGTADIIAVSDLEGHVKILDYKRSKHTCREDEFVFGDDKWGLGPCSRIKNNSNGHYTVQLNLYRVMLMRHYGVKIESMELVRLYPGLPSYELIPVPIIEDVIVKILNERKREIRIKRLFKAAAAAILLMAKHIKSSPVYPTQLTQPPRATVSMSTTRDETTHVSNSISMSSESKRKKDDDSDTASSSDWSLTAKKNRVVKKIASPAPPSKSSLSEWSVERVKKYIARKHEEIAPAPPDTITIDRALYNALVEYYKVHSGFIDKKSLNRLELFRKSL